MAASRTPAATQRSIIWPPRQRFTLRLTWRVLLMRLSAALVVFRVSVRLSGSRWVAAAAAVLTIVAFPRLYNHHKVFLYVAAIGLAWVYAHRGSRWHVSLMAALAFLLRHDHGVYIAVMMVCFLGLREWGGTQLWRPLTNGGSTCVGPRGRQTPHGRIEKCISG